MKGPRFEQMDLQFQPQPLAAIEMIQREPIRLSAKRVVACDGGKFPSIALSVSHADASSRTH